MLRCWLRVAWLLTVVAGVGGLAACEARRFAEVQRNPRPDRCLRYLSRYPQGRRARRVRQWLDDARFAQARRADRPLSYRQYLEAFPQGRHRAAARRQLARLALARARTLADYELVIERYPHSAEASAAWRRRDALLARRALASSGTTSLEVFLATTEAGTRLATRVREELARRRLAEIGDDPLAIERFLARFGDTPAADAAQDRLRAALIQAVESTMDPALMRLFAARFPDDPELGRLRGRAAQRRRWLALCRVDLSALRKLPDAESHDGVRVVLAACGDRADRCADLRKRARAAAPWRPQRELATVLRDVYDGDPAVAWRAMATLAELDDVRAGRRLLELVGSARIVDVWPATRALRRWLDRASSSMRQRLADSAEASPKELVADDVRQRRAVFALLDTDDSAGDRSQRALAQLQQLESRAGRRIVAATLLIEYGGGAPAARRWLALASSRIDRLAQVFPSDLSTAALLAASMEEYEAFVLREVSKSLPSVVARASSAKALLRRLSGLIGEWGVRLAQADPSFEPAHLVDRRSEVADHRKGRLAALRALMHDRRQAARAIALAYCDSLTDESAGWWRGFSPEELEPWVTTCKRRGGGEE